jgi:hypothetical protein
VQQALGLISCTTKSKAKQNKQIRKHAQSFGCPLKLLQNKAGEPEQIATVLHQVLKSAFLTFLGQDIQNITIFLYSQ